MKYFLLGALLLLGACSSTEPSETRLDLDKLAGQWVVVNYWAIWCKPCAQEIPELNALAAVPGVSVFGVNYDGASGEELARQVKKLAINFPILDTDPAAQLGVPRPVVLPTTLIIDPQGELREPLVGPQTLESLKAATGQVSGGE